MKDQGLNVIIGLREKGKTWDKAVQDGWVPGKTLFSLEEAAERGTVIQYLLSDAGQKGALAETQATADEGQGALFLAWLQHRLQGTDWRHPAGQHRRHSGRSKGLRHHGAAAIPRRQGHQCQLRDPSRRHGPRRTAVLALGFAIGSGYLFETTFQKEVFSDLTGERGVLMGAIYGLWLAQYEVLREHGHSPSEAFNETVEEATQSLYPLIGENGMDWMYANCSTTAQRGALDWFEKFRAAAKPVFEELYKKVVESAKRRSACWMRIAEPITGSSWKKN